VLSRCRTLWCPMLVDQLARSGFAVYRPRQELLETLAAAAASMRNIVRSGDDARAAARNGRRGFYGFEHRGGTVARAWQMEDEDSKVRGGLGNARQVVSTMRRRPSPSRLGRCASNTRCNGQGTLGYCDRCGRRTFDSAEFGGLPPVADRWRRAFRGQRGATQSSERAWKRHLQTCEQKRFRS
jgi:hypothetical protein